MRYTSLPEHKSLFIVYGEGFGIGKTAFLTAFLGIPALVGRGAYERKLKCYAEIDDLNKSRTVKLSKPRCLLFADYTIWSRGCGVVPQKSYWIDGKDLGIDGIEGGKRSAFIPCFATVVLDEFEDKADSRDSKSFRPELQQAILKHRHFDWRLGFSTHRFKDLDTRMRSFALVILIEGMKSIKDENNKTIGTTWTVREFEKYRHAELYDATLDPKYGEVKKYYYEGCVFHCYDDHEFRPLNYKGRENRDFDLKEGPEDNEILKNDYKVIAPEQKKKIKKAVIST